jgi:hypothetical protein
MGGNWWRIAQLEIDETRSILERHRATDHHQIEDATMIRGGGKRQEARGKRQEARALE